MGKKEIPVSVIAKETLILLERELDCENETRKIIGSEQWNGDFCVEEKDLLKPLDEFSERFLKPCVQSLKGMVISSLKELPLNLGREYRKERLPLPTSSETIGYKSGAVEVYNDMCVRVIEYYECNDLRIRIDFIVLNPAMA